MERLKGFTNSRLAQHLLWVIWAKQNSDGVSHGGSPENIILEAVLQIIPNKIKKRTSFTEKELLEEAEKRIHNLDVKSLRRHINRLRKRLENNWYKKS
ncbi:MAG: hypothetical protein HZB99_03810 [Candidatus Harrisonbacteria bacterium]|nr:hypothetical protein [Candidatus Harrisonbacteria bacterium]